MTVPAIAVIEQAFANATTKQDVTNALALVDQHLDENQPLTLDESCALRCHQQPGEILDCRRNDNHPEIWVHSAYCTLHYFRAVAKIEAARA